MTRPIRYYTIPEIRKQLGATDSKVRYAILSLPIVPARQYGKARLFTAEQVNRLKEHFNAKQGGNNEQTQAQV